MKYLYLMLEILLYILSAISFFVVFSKYHYQPALEKKVEKRHKTAQNALVVFLALFFGMVLVVFLVWHNVGQNQPHHIGYFTSFFVSCILTLAFFRNSLPHIDLRLCLPSMAIIWALLLIFEGLLLYNNAGWIYTDSTVFTISIGGYFSIILENLIFFYIFAPYISILIFTALAENRSDKQAFLLTMAIIWVCGAIWEYLSIGIFNLWYMVEDRSVLAFNLFDARTTLEEMLYYVPFAALSILVYLGLYYRKYRYFPNAKARREQGTLADKI